MHPTPPRRLGRLSCALALATAAPALVQGPPDLSIDALDVGGVAGDWQTLGVSGTASLAVSNLGDSAAGSFRVLLFDDRNGSGAFEAGDTLLGSAQVPGLAAGSSANVAVAVFGAVDFRHDHIHAYADADFQVAEGDESNNAFDTSIACVGEPPPIVFNPVVQWHWNGSSVNPDERNVMMTPGVMDVTGGNGLPDGVPDIVFGATSDITGRLDPPGTLRVVDGATGQEWYAVTSPRISCSDSVALGDIDHDGLPEIVAVAESDHLVAFEHDGTFKWLSVSTVSSGYGAVALADLEGDGAVEILFGRVCYRADGSQRWNGIGGTGAQISYAADMDADPELEVIAGQTIYDHLGNIQTLLPTGDGYTAVADLDQDGQPEQIVVSGGTIRALCPGGSFLWGPAVIPGGGHGGPPTVADYDGDGAPEVGVAGALSYTVYDADGTQLWTQPVDDTSSNVTGSSVFDFEGDGAAEVVYRDQTTLRVYRGTDGTVLFSFPISSCTWSEYVLVADVDADRHAEIVAVANTNCGYGPQQGVYVLRNDLDDFVNTRQLWNQHAYSITNVDDDGAIPANPPANWQFPSGDPYNNFRQNLPSGGVDPLAQPDLSASYLRFACSGGDLLITGRLGNGGAAPAPAGVNVCFYLGGPGGVPLGCVATAAPLAPGAYLDVILSVPQPGPSGLVAMEVDGAYSGAGVIAECDETDNGHEATFTAPTLLLHDPAPGVTGVFNTIAATGAAPGSVVCFFAACWPGQAPVAGCNGLFLGLHNPRLVGAAPADSSGAAAVAGFVANRYAGDTLYFQALVHDCCALSNVVAYPFP